jgi:hypothetical protein
VLLAAEVVQSLRAAGIAVEVDNYALPVMVLVHAGAAHRVTVNTRAAAAAAAAMRVVSHHVVAAAVEQIVDRLPADVVADLPEDDAVTGSVVEAAAVVAVDVVPVRVVDMRSVLPFRTVAVEDASAVDAADRTDMPVRQAALLSAVVVVVHSVDDAVAVPVVDVDAAMSDVPHEPVPPVAAVAVAVAVEVVDAEVADAVDDIAVREHTVL